MDVDRNDQDSAAEVINYLIPEETHQQLCLSFLANTIGIAHDLSPDRWGITLKKDTIRLNVGNIEVIVITPDIFYCVLDFDTIPKELRKLGKDETVFFLENENDPEAGLYKSVPKSVGCRMLIEDAEKIFPLLQDSHRILVENASQTRRHAMTKKGHSPAVADYLSTYLEKKIPQPEY